MFWRGRLMQNLMHICCSTPSVILNATATQYTCSLNGIYHPHWLVQWSHHCSHMGIPFHSPWLPDYIDVMQTILVILTMVGLFLDRPRIHHKKIFFHQVLHRYEPSVLEIGQYDTRNNLSWIWIMKNWRSCKRYYNSIWLFLYLAHPPASSKGLLTQDYESFSIHSVMFLNSVTIL